MQLLANDIGYGHVKNISTNAAFKFQTAIEFQRISQADISGEMVYKFEGDNYLIGSLASGNALSTRDYTFLKRSAPLLLFKSIIDAGLDPEKEIRIATGLSLLNWSKRKEFADRLADFTVNNIRVHKTNIMLIPQGKGVYLQAMKDQPGLSSKLVLVVDIGFYTINVIPFSNGKPLASESWSTNQGVNQAITEIRTYIEKEYSITCNDITSNEMFQTRTIKLGGDSRDLSIIIDAEKRRYTQKILNELQTRNSDLYKSADLILFAGGGGYMFSDLLTNKNQRIVDNPEYANAYGYWQALNGG